MKADKRVLTTGEVAKICSVAPRTVSKWFDQGHLRGYRIPGSKDRRIPLDQLIRFMRVHNIPLNGLDQEELHVVVLDNDVAFSETLANALQENGGYEVTATTCAFEAGAIVRETKPQAVIIDVSLPDVDAKKISRFIRSQGELKATKIIGIAQHLDQGRGQALLQVGFDAYLSKPFDMQSLLRLLESGATGAAVY